MVFKLLRGRRASLQFPCFESLDACETSTLDTPPPAEDVFASHCTSPHKGTTSSAPIPVLVCSPTPRRHTMHHHRPSQHCKDFPVGGYRQFQAFPSPAKHRPSQRRRNSSVLMTEGLQLDIAKLTQDVRNMQVQDPSGHMSSGRGGMDLTETTTDDSDNEGDWCAVVTVQPTVPLSTHHGRGRLAPRRRSVQSSLSQLGLLQQAAAAGTVASTYLAPLDVQSVTSHSTLSIQKKVVPPRVLTKKAPVPGPAHQRRPSLVASAPPPPAQSADDGWEHVEFDAPNFDAASSKITTSAHRMIAAASTKTNLCRRHQRRQHKSTLRTFVNNPNTTTAAPWRLTSDDTDACAWGL